MARGNFPWNIIHIFAFFLADCLSISHNIHGIIALHSFTLNNNPFVCTMYDTRIAFVQITELQHMIATKKWRSSRGKWMSQPTLRILHKQRHKERWKIYEIEPILGRNISWIEIEDCVWVCDFAFGKPKESVDVCERQREIWLSIAHISNPRIKNSWATRKTKPEHSAGKGENDAEKMMLKLECAYSMGSGCFAVCARVAEEEEQNVLKNW